MTFLRAPGYPEAAVRARARRGAAAAFPPLDDYGGVLFGAGALGCGPPDRLDEMRLVPPVFMPERLDKLVELAREPLHGDVGLDTDVGGLRSTLPVYVCAFGSTQVASGELGIAVSRQAGRLGVPMVIGENAVPVNGYGRTGAGTGGSVLARIRAYLEHADPATGGVVVQQSTEDADAEVWNLVYSDPSAQVLLDTGRLGFELKVGQGAKPGLGGMTVVDRGAAAALADRYAIEDVFADDGRLLRCASPGTFTAEILHQQVRLMRNNYPRAKVWVKLHPGRDVREAAVVADRAGADAVTVDGAEGGTGWAPRAFLDHMGLPLAECLRRVGPDHPRLLTSGRFWEGTRTAKSLALGATAVGLGRAALLAADEDAEWGLVRLVECLALELRLVVSALGRYHSRALCPDDVWDPYAGGSRCAGEVRDLDR